MEEDNAVNDYVDDFINKWNADFNTLYHEKLYELFPFNNGVSPTSCTLFARSIFYAMYNNTDPNGDDNIEDIFITADTLDLRRVLNENNIFDGQLHKIDIWYKIDQHEDVIHSFVIYFNEPNVVYIAQSYGDETVCTAPAVFTTNVDVILLYFHNLVHNTEDKMLYYKSLCGLFLDTQMDDLMFDYIQITTYAPTIPSTKKGKPFKKPTIVKHKKIIVPKKNAKGITKRRKKHKTKHKTYRTRHLLK